MTRPTLTSLQTVAPASPDTSKRHVLMTLDAVGGVWRYAMDLASNLGKGGYRFTFAGLGPQPTFGQRAEAERLGDLVWLDAPLDWLVQDERALDAIPPLLASLVAEREIDLVHLNLPSQAAGLVLPVPVLVVSHSCVVTWFGAVRGTDVPEDWLWQKRRNRAGFDNSDIVVSPSQSHAEMLVERYGAIPHQRVVHNGSRPTPGSADKEKLVFAAGRWWDDGKNLQTLDKAAAGMDWPLVLAGSNRGPAGQFVAVEHAPAGDADAFARAVNSLIRDPERREETAGKARERAQRFSLGAQASAMGQVYADLLNHAPNARRA